MVRLSSAFVLLLLFSAMTASLSQSALTPNDPRYFDNKDQGQIMLDLVEFWDAFYEREFYDKGLNPAEVRGSGYKPYMRWKWHVARRADSTGYFPSRGRWDAYVKSKELHLGRGNSVPSATWQSLGPTNKSGRILCYAFDPINPDILWAGSAGGGLWRTEDAAENWEPMTDDIPSLAIGALAINPQNRNSMLIGTGEAFGSVLMISGVGVLRSADRGLTWDDTSFDFEQYNNVNCFNLAWDWADTTNVYLASNYGLWASRDGGENWDLSFNGICNAVLIHPRSPEVLYAVMQGNGIYKSYDKGNTWQAYSNGLPPAGAEIGFTSLAICDSFPNVLYAGISNGNVNSGYGTLQGFYRTNDGGENWTLLETPDFYCYPSFPDICQGWYDNVTAVSPDDSNLVYAGGIHLYKSDDGGVNWDFSGGSWPNLDIHVDHHNFAFHPDDPNIVYDFSDGGVYRSLDAGENWEEKNNGLTSMQFYSIASALTDTAIVSGGSQDNGTWVGNNENGNTEWVSWFGGDGMVTNIDYTNPQTMYATWQFGNHGKTLDGGATAFVINNGITEEGPWVTPVIFDPDDPETLFTASDLKIYKTTDGGLLWEPIANLAGIGHLAIDNANHDIMYSAIYTIWGNSTTLYKSENGGYNWTWLTAPGTPISDLEADPVLPGVVYRTTPTYSQGQQIWRSGDYGETWENISSDFPPIPANCITINPSNPNHLYVGTDIGVYLSIDSGGSWFEYNEGLPNVYVWDMHFHPGDYTVRVGTYGRGAWKVEAADSLLGIVNIDTPAEQIPEQIALEPAYPNPFNPSTMLTFKLSSHEKVTLRIYNQLGQRVRDLLNEKRPAGRHQMLWDGINNNGLQAASGTYFVQLRAGDVSKTVSIKLVR